MHIIFRLDTKSMLSMEVLPNLKNANSRPIPRKSLRKDGEAKNSGVWSQTEQKMYIIFLEHNQKQLQSKHKRKNHKIFKEMAHFIGTRDGIQCRSHHMKLLRTHSKMRKIISHFKQALDLGLPASSSKTEVFQAKFEAPMNKKQEIQIRQDHQHTGSFPVEQSLSSDQVVIPVIFTNQASSTLLETANDGPGIFIQPTWNALWPHQWVYFYNGQY